jgi:cytochrome c553
MMSDAEAAEIIAEQPLANIVETSRLWSSMRGEHLVKARYACLECHGSDFGGGVMVDDPNIGTLRGPNLTRGQGSRTKDYTTKDWDRLVRRGVKPDGTASVMPSEDFALMSDQELSDIITYIEGLPTRDTEVPAPTFGPLGKILLATGQFPLSVTLIGDATPPREPPAEAPDATFGKHLAQVCTGCHQHDLSGGPIRGAPPDWAPAADLRKSALQGWTLTDFTTSMREGKRKDGTPFKTPMDKIPPIARNMTEVEITALWAYIQTVP